MGIEVKRWDIQPDVYDLGPITKGGVALQAIDHDTYELAGRVHVLPEAIAYAPVVSAASLVLKLSTSVRMLMQK